jgi:hypothetical protein
VGVGVGVGATSSLMIVPVPSAVPMVALKALLRWTVNASFGSMVLSPITLTVICFDVSAGKKVNVPALN